MTNSEPFALGAYFRGWMMADGLANMSSSNDLGRALDEQWRGVAARLFVVFRDYQKQVGVTDDQLIVAGKGKAETKERIAFWSRQPRPF
jgi:hypothetical protein